MDKLIDKVVVWANEKSLFDDNSPDAMVAQADKLLEEAQEVFDELAKFADYGKAKMEIGDVLVVCTILSHKLGTTPEACMQLAYDKISKRTGKTINGVFVKDK